MAANIIGVETDAGEARIAVVEKRLRSHKLIRLVRQTYDGANPGARADAIKTALASVEYDPQKDSVIPVFPASRVSRRTLTIPLVRPGQVAGALAGEVEADAPFDAEDMAIDHITISRDDTATRVMAVIARKDDLARFLEDFRAGGVEPDAVAPAPIAIAVESLISGQPAPGSLTAYLHIDGDNSSITLVMDNTPISFHCLALGAGAEPGLIARELKRQTMALTGAYENLALNSVTISGAVERDGETARNLCDALGISVASGAMPGVGIAVEGGGDTSGFTAPVGAALAYAKNDKRFCVNLMSRVYKRKPRLFGYGAQMFTASALLGIGLLVCLASFIAQGVALEGKYNTLKRGVRTQFKRALPDIKNIVSETKQMENALVQIRQTAGTLGAGPDGRDPFLNILLDVTSSVPEDTRLEIEELVYGTGALSLSGSTESFEKIDQFKKTMENLPWARKVTVDKAKADISGSAVEFRIEVEVSI